MESFYAQPVNHIVSQVKNRHKYVRFTIMVNCMQHD